MKSHISDAPNPAHQSRTRVLFINRFHAPLLALLLSQQSDFGRHRTWVLRIATVKITLTQF
jgi:hypothetical protein